VNELALQLGYNYIFYGPSDQFVYFNRVGHLYNKPEWYCLIDKVSLLKDLSSMKRYSKADGFNITQVVMPWGEYYTL
jgi:hypothetical protein